MHEGLKEVCRKIGVKTAGHRIASLGKIPWRNAEKELFFSAKKRQIGAAGFILGSFERGHAQGAAYL